MARMGRFVGVLLAGVLLGCGAGSTQAWVVKSAPDEVLNDAGYRVSEGDDTWLGFQVYIGTSPGWEGHDNRAFFFTDGSYAGNDDPQPSAGLWLAWRTIGTIALNYALYRPGDSMCCPSAGIASVRYQWDGQRLVALDPLPPAAWDAAISRR